MKYLRLVDQEHDPNEEEILAAIGDSTLWFALREYIDRNYDFVPEQVFYGKKYGWTIRYRKSGKTLVSLFPEYGAFTVLIVLGKKEGEKAAKTIDELSASTRDLIGSTKQLHDGKWLWIRILEPHHVDDVKLILAAKRKPRA